MTEFIPRPCDRCGAGTIDEDYTTEKVVTPMCAEFHMAHGVITWLCFDCRKKWHQVIDGHELSRKYEEASFRYEFWKGTLSDETTDDDREKGLGLYRVVSDLERQINKFAHEWLAGTHD